MRIFQVIYQIFKEDKATAAAIGTAAIIAIEIPGRCFVDINLMHAANVLYHGFTCGARGRPKIAILALKQLLIVGDNF